MASLEPLLTQVAGACTLCAAHLPLGPRPVLQMHASARILVAAQAPGRKVHASGLPFDDASGQRLRDWLGVTRETFYDPTQLAILPVLPFVIPEPASRATCRHARNARRRGARGCSRTYPGSNSAS